MVVFASVLTPAFDTVAGWWRHVRDTRGEPPAEEPLSERDPESGVFFHFGRATIITMGALRALLRRPLELRSTIAQVEALGVQSVGIAITTAVLVGMVMAVQFAYGLQRFGGMEYTGRFIGLSFTRELAPTLTGIVVGGRMAAGMAPEIGAMAVSEQVDAIKACGADPLKKLVVPRLVGAIIVMPILGMIALVTGFCGAMLMTSHEFGIPAQFFYRTALDSVKLVDLWSGLLKMPVFGALIAIIGCHFGLITKGGTEGVGRYTTRAVVVSAITVLVSDYFLTTVGVMLWPSD
ncbi:MAG: ABC transporter permease [Polyangiaceae bacterium]|nr:ABC transporter permease [Polyangiaceae bacterium]